MIVEICWEGAPFSQVISNGRLVEPFSFVEELGDVFWGVSEQLVLHQKHDALRKTAHRHGNTRGKLPVGGHFIHDIQNIPFWDPC